MKQTHTPGPWRRYRDKKGRVSKIEGRGGRVCTFQPSDLNVEANASLIAAAPDLLEALEEIVASNPSVTINSSGWMEDVSAIEKARNAIRRARGEE